MSAMAVTFLHVKRSNLGVSNYIGALCSLIGDRTRGSINLCLHFLRGQERLETMRLPVSFHNLPNLYAHTRSRKAGDPTESLGLFCIAGCSAGDVFLEIEYVVQVSCTRVRLSGALVESLAAQPQDFIGVILGPRRAGAAAVDVGSRGADGANHIIDAARA